MSEVVFVIPCFNEARRLDEPQFKKLLETPWIGLLFVNDGSTDDTQAALEKFCADRPSQAHCLNLPGNVGKGEAVRQGLREALKTTPPMVGYADADLATPGSELLRIAETLRNSPPTLCAILGARVKRLGSRIQRKRHRHILGRLFATVVSSILGLPVYDTQCGAKCFRNNTALQQALADPFHSRWIFDVELLARLGQSYATAMPDAPPLDRFLELPLTAWQDISGSKIRLFNAFRILADLLFIARRYGPRSKSK